MIWYLYILWMMQYRFILGTKNWAKASSTWINISATLACCYFFIYFYFWLPWALAARRLSLVAESGGFSSLRCTGFSLWLLVLLRSTGSRHAGSVVVAHGLSCSVACGIFPDRGSNLCPLHGRRILNHCATREVLACCYWYMLVLAPLCL